MLKDQRNRFAEVRQAPFARIPLTVCARHFGTVRDVPGAVLLDDGRELIVHRYIVSFGREGIRSTNQLSINACSARRMGDSKKGPSPLT